MAPYAYIVDTYFSQTDNIVVNFGQLGVSAGKLTKKNRELRQLVSQKFRQEQIPST